MNELAPTSLIVGCGYLGTRVAERLLARGMTVYGTRRRQQSAAELSRRGVRPLLLQVTQPLTYAALRPALEAEALDVYYMVPPGRADQHPSPRQTVLGGIGHMLKALSQARNLRRAVLVSSSAVWGQRNDEPVDANTPAQPANERAELLLEGERLWRSAGPWQYVVRLAGLYGPSRVVGLRPVIEGAPLIGNPESLLNLIHVDDAADLLLALMRAEAPAAVELGCDGHPVPRRAYYTWLAQTLGVTPPRVLDDAEAAAQFGVNTERLRRSSSKALDPGPTCRRTGWRPAYPDYQQGLAAVLEEHARRKNR